MKLPTRMNIAIGALVMLCVTQTYQLFFIAENLVITGWGESQYIALFMKGILAVGNALTFSTDNDGVVDYSEWFQRGDGLQKIPTTRCENVAQRLASGSWNSTLAAEIASCERGAYRDATGWHYNEAALDPDEMTTFGVKHYQSVISK